MATEKETPHQENKSSSNSSIDVDEWKTFQNKNHSLSINASDVATCTGYHEYQSCPELMMKHIYQGYDGQQLLQQDTQILGLLETNYKDNTEYQEEIELLQIAELTGSDTIIDAVKRTLKIKHGDIEERNKIQTIEDATILKRKAGALLISSDESTTTAAAADITDNNINNNDTILLKKIRNRLTTQQLHILQERTRQSVDTGCGHSWEAMALDQYERNCGWDIRERNAECRLWHFERIDDDNDDDDENNNNNNNNNTIRPTGPAYARRHSSSSRHNNNNKKTKKDHDHDQFDSRGVKRNKLRTYEKYVNNGIAAAGDSSEISSNAILYLNNDKSSSSSSSSTTHNILPADENGNEKINKNYSINDDDDIILLATDDTTTTSNTTSNVTTTTFEQEMKDSCNRQQQQDKVKPPLNDASSPPFLTIKGMVDGIRDELRPTTTTTTPGRRKEKNNNNNNNNSGGDNDDDKDDESNVHDQSSLLLSRVVVECKHRMRLLLPYPRFSECIQSVVYCFMYEADSADIIQKSTSLATRKEEEHTEDMDTETTTTASSSTVTKCPKNIVLDDTVPYTTNDVSNATNFSKVCTDIQSADKCGNDDDTMLSKNKSAIRTTTSTTTMATTTATNTTTTKLTTATTKPDISIKIAVNRISLDDHFGHRINWNTIILPKLRQWTDAVYEIRSDDNKRYRLLSMMAMTQSSSSSLALPSSIVVSEQQRLHVQEEDESTKQHHQQRECIRTAWELIFDECDFLRDGISGERYRRDITGKK
ncbi:hypothetical protein FRACYDRAFT_236236 [Fragilariopsis cylindrus CCMP1102]|uniref:Uncharacterized protein n=1 Tax=Fragilariopsis cylindrus CCMP1102 TaxID=635003 RepID=A0A1E7FPV0_9STRA|nr:hypothetical protein FRACYDRAFT_236236 [Fragilariopsis cylindrus CCMP1102]|eukprot:OEU20167.1 hypothetical protein FRACYDRAFT_236236 [Fragilariopsis cylindrus CCMP1102]